MTQLILFALMILAVLVGLGIGAFLLYFIVQGFRIVMGWILGRIGVGHVK